MKWRSRRVQFNNYAGFFRIIISLILAMCLRIAPWPGDMAAFNPDWVLLFLIYWALAQPEHVGIFHAWVFGILVDVLTGRLLGQYALAYSIIVYICLKLHKRLRQFPFFQQGLFVFFCLLLSQLLLFLQLRRSLESAMMFLILVEFPSPLPKYLAPAAVKVSVGRPESCL